MLSFWRHVTPSLWVGTIVVSGLRIRSYSVITIGQPSTNMLTISPSHVIGTDKKEECLGDMNSS